jgi:hypothetical protein
VLLVLLAVVAPLVMVVPFTTTLVTDVLLPVETVMFVVALSTNVVTTGVNPAAEAGPVIVTVLVPPEVALYPAAVILAATLVATVVLLVLAVDALLMMLTPFTVIEVTDVLLAPENVIVADWLPTFVTTGVKPPAEKGPKMVTTLPEAVALNPLRPIAPAVFEASVLELLDATDGLAISWTPFTVMLVTDVLLDPLKVMVAFGIGGEAVTTGTAPAAARGPVIVTVLPEAVAL